MRLLLPPGGHTQAAQTEQSPVNPGRGHQVSSLRCQEQMLSFMWVVGLVPLSPFSSSVLLWMQAGESSIICLALGLPSSFIMLEMKTSILPVIVIPLKAHGIWSMSFGHE